MTRPQILDKVRKLNATACDPTEEPEARATAARICGEWCKRHKVTRDELMASDPKQNGNGNGKAHTRHKPIIKPQPAPDFENAVNDLLHSGADLLAQTIMRNLGLRR